MSFSACDRCGETISDIDAGFSPGVHEMAHNCGGTWRVLPGKRIRPGVRATVRTGPLFRRSGTVRRVEDGMALFEADSLKEGEPLTWYLLEDFLEDLEAP